MIKKVLFGFTMAVMFVGGAMADHIYFASNMTEEKCLAAGGEFIGQDETDYRPACWCNDPTKPFYSEADEKCIAAPNNPNLVFNTKLKENTADCRNRRKALYTKLNKSQEFITQAVACCDPLWESRFDAASGKCVCLGSASGQFAMYEDKENGMRGACGNTEGVTVLNNQIALALGLTDKRTVWKTTDDKFNYARLGVDAGAGVVLGTVGGVVTGVVMKKKQVEKGFEDIQCHIGGQQMVTWGDEFLITTQR